MNFVAGFLLLISGGKEDETFWFLVGLLSNNHLSELHSFDPLAGLYQTSFPLLLSYLDTFDRLLVAHLPKLKAHFDSIGMVPQLWVMKWFQTLFLYSFPFGFCIRVWDCYLAEGRDFIFKLKLAICKMYELELLKLDMTGANDFFNSFCDKDAEDDSSNSSTTTTIRADGYRT